MFGYAHTHMCIYIMYIRLKVCITLDLSIGKCFKRLYAGKIAKVHGTQRKILRFCKALKLETQKKAAA